MSRYAIWNKEDTIYTPRGEALTPEQWIGRYAWIAHPAAVPVVAGGLFNGGFSGELSQMRELYESIGADFSACTTNEEVLSAIEAYEDEINASSEEASTEERIAAALEYQNLSSMPDAE